MDYPRQLSSVPVNVMWFMLCLLVSVLEDDLFLTLTFELGSIFLEPMGPQHADHLDLADYPSYQGRGLVWESPGEQTALSEHLSCSLKSRAQHPDAPLAGVSDTLTCSSFFHPVPDSHLPPMWYKGSDVSKKVCNLAPVCRSGKITIPLVTLKHCSLQPSKQTSYFSGAPLLDSRMRGL